MEGGQRRPWGLEFHPQWPSAVSENHFAQMAPTRSKPREDHQPHVPREGFSRFSSLTVVFLQGLNAPSGDQPRHSPAPQPRGLWPRQTPCKDSGSQPCVTTPCTMFPKHTPQSGTLPGQAPHILWGSSLWFHMHCQPTLGELSPSLGIEDTKGTPLGIWWV